MKRRNFARLMGAAGLWPLEARAQAKKLRAVASSRSIRHNDKLQMFVSRLRISGFRGITQADIRFGKTAVLVGPNSVGKTTLIEALALILGRDGMVRTLTEHDFYGSSPAREHRIRIIATIVGFGHPDPTRHPDWFAFRKGRAEMV